ncbi:MAG: replication-associated recombination protein A, partial [bacterium]
VTSGIKEVKELIEGARRNLEDFKKRTILFIDEIHRFNKAQQDAFLPHVETGTIILVGATTENPSFSLIAPLLSRCRVFTLKPLMPDALRAILDRAVRDEKEGFGKEKLEIEEGFLDAIVALADSDARRGLNSLELLVRLKRGETKEGPLRLSIGDLKELSRRQALLYDRAGEEHYNLISALHKSLRGSDPDASLYWLARMLAAGEDPRYVARRMIRFATEDIGLADPQALTVALAAHDAYHQLGTPEGELALAQACVYLATAPKSNSVYVAMGEVMEEIQRSGSLPVPLVIRNAPTRLMKDLGYGKGYQYDHDAPDHYVPKENLPDGLTQTHFYTPGPFGFEKEIQKRLEWWAKKRKEAEGKD